MVRELCNLVRDMERTGQRHVLRASPVLSPSYIFSYAILTKVNLRCSYLEVQIH